MRKYHRNTPPKQSLEFSKSYSVRLRPNIICHDENEEFPPYIVFQGLDFRQYPVMKFLNGLTVTGDQFQRFINKLEGGEIHILGSGTEITNDNESLKN